MSSPEKVIFARQLGQPMVVPGFMSTIFTTIFALHLGQEISRVAFPFKGIFTLLQNPPNIGQRVTFNNRRFA
jgi:hypothetical protein